MYFTGNFNAKSCNGSFSIVIGPNKTGLRVDVILVFHILRKNMRYYRFGITPNGTTSITQWHNVHYTMAQRPLHNGTTSITQWHNVHSDVCEAL